MTSLLPLDPECWCCLLWPVTGDTRATYVARLEANHGWAQGRHVHLRAGEPLRLPQSAPSEDVLRAPYFTAVAPRERTS